MIAVWIIVGLLIAVVGGTLAYFVGRFMLLAIVRILGLFGQLFFERKLTMKILTWGIKRNEDWTMNALGILVWILVGVIVGAMGTAIGVPLYLAFA
jgi:hypothetical protein